MKIFFLLGFSLLCAGCVANTPAPVPLPPSPTPSVTACARGGCSGQLCLSATQAGKVVTTCEYRPEFSCYQTATCEVQANGQCGWTQTSALTACLKQASALKSPPTLPKN